MASAEITKPEHKNKKRKKEKAEKAAEEPKAAKAPAAAKVKVPATPEEEARRQKQRECRERALAAREGGKAYVSSYKVRAKKRPQQAQRKFERRQEGLPSKAVRNTERRARKWITRPTERYGRPARPKRMIGSGWPKLGAAWSTIWRKKRPPERQLAGA